MLVSDRVIKAACLLVFVLWHDNSCVLMRMHITTVSPKADKTKFIVNRSIYNRCIMAI